MLAASVAQIVAVTYTYRQQLNFDCSSGIDFKVSFVVNSIIKRPAVMLTYSLCKRFGFRLNPEP